MTDNNGILLFGVGILIGVAMATLLLLVRGTTVSLNSSPTYAAMPTYVPITKSMREG